MSSSEAKKSLLIISDTPLIESNNRLFIFEPTLNEIESISHLFRKIVWVTYLRNDPKMDLYKCVSPPNIVIIPFRHSRGGASLLKKIKILCTLPAQYFFIWKELRKHDVIHSRGPSVPAIIGIIHSFFDRKRIYWHKYAGNWAEVNPPIAYRLQRWLLKTLDKNNIRITINGNWTNLHSRFMSWENPCISKELLGKSRLNGNYKFNGGKLKICFVGTLDVNKGAVRLAKALNGEEFKNHIEGVWFIGEGTQKEELKNLAKSSAVPFNICGAMGRNKIFTEIYAACHLLILPSKSEGFPKVVAEAAAHFCIPVVTKMSSLDQYIENEINGFFLQDSTTESIRCAFRSIINRKEDLPLIANSSFLLAEKFTYTRFCERVRSEII
ncbi:MAG: glycosyltransferase [Cyclobacteriaceae bacterium]